MKDIFLDGALPPVPTTAQVLVEKSDKTGYFWHILVTEEQKTKLINLQYAHTLTNQASFDKLPTNLRNGELPIHEYMGGLHISESAEKGILDVKE